MHIDFSDAEKKGLLMVDAAPICGASPVAVSGSTLSIHPHVSQPARVRLTLSCPGPDLSLSSLVTNPVPAAKPVRFTMRACDQANRERGCTSVTVSGGSSATMAFRVSDVSAEVFLEFVTEMANPTDAADYAWSKFERVCLGSFDDGISKSDFSDIPRTSALAACVRSASWTRSLDLMFGYKTVAEPDRYGLLPFVCENSEALIPIANATLKTYKDNQSIETDGISLYAFEGAQLLPHGVILIDGKAVTETMAPLPPKYKDHVVAVWRSSDPKAVAKLCQSEESCPVLVLEQPGVYNYGHWLIEMFPKLFSVIDHIKAGNVRIALREELKLSRIISETLMYVGIQPNSICWIPNEPVSLAKLLYVSPISKHQHPGYISPWCIAMLERFTETSVGGTPQKLFVSRKDASKRFLVNEDEIYAILEPMGYRYIRAGEMSFAEQVRAFRDASHIVGVFGASLTNIVFSPPGTKVMNLCPNNFFDHFYLNISSLKNISYTQLIGSIVDNDVKPDISLYDFYIDIHKFAKIFHVFDPTVG